MVKTQNINRDLLAVLIIQCVLCFLFYSLTALLELLGDAAGLPWVQLSYSNEDSLVEFGGKPWSKLDDLGYVTVTS